METKEIKENNVLKNINITFQESLKSGILLTYLFSEGEKRFGGITLDGQYRFTLYKKGSNEDDIVFWETKIFSDFLGDDENSEKTWENIKEEAFESFEYSSLHNQLGGYGIPNKIISFDNLEEIDEFFLELEQSKIKSDVNNILE